MAYTKVVGGDLLSGAFLERCMALAQVDASLFRKYYLQYVEALIEAAYARATVDLEMVKILEQALVDCDQVYERLRPGGAAKASQPPG